MTPDELIDKLEEIKAAYGSRIVRAPFTSSERRLIDKYYYHITGRTFKKGGCSSCYSDAFINMYNLLKKTKAFMKEESEFILKRGVVLATIGVKSVLAGRDVPAEQALEHLAKFPDKIRLFETFPADWKQRAENLGKEVEPKVEPTVEPKVEPQQILTGEEKELIAKLSTELQAGALKKELRESFKNYEIYGKTVTVRQLNEYMKQASEQIGG